MTGLSLVLSMLVASQPPVGAMTSEEIVVIGKKLARTEGEIRTNVLTGRSKCIVRKTSGDARVDTAVCDIAIGCLRARQDGPKFRPCVTEGRQRFLAGLASAAQAGSE